MVTVNVAEFRTQLSGLLDDVEQTHETVMITRQGHPSGVLISPDDYESIMETLAWLNLGATETAEEVLQADRKGEFTSFAEMDAIMAARKARETRS